MRRSTGDKLAAAAALTAMVGSAVKSVLAQGNDASPAPMWTVAAGGIPAVVDPATDLGARTPGPEDDWADSISFTSRVNSGGHDIGLLLHTVRLPKAPGNLLLFSVHDTTTGWYKSYAATIDPSDYAWSTTGLYITAPGLKWTGDARRMSVSLDVPWGSLDIVLHARGPALNHGGTGAFSLFGRTNHGFALPDMRTTGTFTFDGQARPITGQSWLERQWGPIDGSPGNRRSRLNLTMPNGDAVAIRDAVGVTGETHAWATVLRNDGSYELASVVPLADDADEFWTSPATGQRYPTRWIVGIPALQARLTVQVVGDPGQEIVLGGNGRLTATAAFEGTYRGAKVTGRNFAEMAGGWLA